MMLELQIPESGVMSSAEPSQHHRPHITPEPHYPPVLSSWSSLSGSLDGLTCAIVPTRLWN